MSCSLTGKQLLAGAAIDSDDDEELEERLLAPALHVEDDGGPPSAPGTAHSASSYLISVRREASSMPDTLVSQKPVITAVLRAAAVSSDGKSNVVSAHVQFVPSLDWQIHLVTDFSDVRQRLARWKALHGSRVRLASKQLPAMSDDVVWREVLCGSRSIPEGSVSSPCPIQPTLPTLAAITQCDAQRLLELAVDCWRKNSQTLANSTALAAWTFGLMAVLEKPLLPDVTSCLRDLTRILQELRDGIRQELMLDAPTESVCFIASLTAVVTCLVGRYFSQLDLAD